MAEKLVCVFCGHEVGPVGRCPNCGGFGKEPVEDKPDKKKK